LMDDFPEDCFYIHSTYKDNPFLEERIVKSILRHRKNEYWWKVYGLGEIGVREGLVFPFFEQIDHFPFDYPNCYGIDFGYTNSPTTCVRVGVDESNMSIYADELFYSTGMKKSDILSEMRRLKVQIDKYVIADSEDPRLIAELQESEYDVSGAIKQKVKDEIEVVKRYNLYVTKRSINLIKELRNYMYKKDNKTGKWTNEPEDDFNHAIDALRYALLSMVRPSTGGAILGMSTITGKDYE